MEVKSTFLLLSNMRHMIQTEMEFQTLWMIVHKPMVILQLIKPVVQTTIAMVTAIQAMLSLMTQANSAIMMEMVAVIIPQGLILTNSPTIVHNVVIQMETVMETILAATAPINSHWTQVNGTIPMEMVTEITH